MTTKQIKPELVGASFNKGVEIVRIRCICGYTFQERSDKRMVPCPKCAFVTNIASLRTEVK